MSAHTVMRGRSAMPGWCLTTLLPAMRLAEAFETTRLHRVAGLTSNCAALTVAHLGRLPP